MFVGYLAFVAELNVGFRSNLEQEASRDVFLNSGIDPNSSLPSSCS